MARIRKSKTNTAYFMDLPEKGVKVLKHPKKKTVEDYIEI